jgi:hypothetical protein
MTILGACTAGGGGSDARTTGAAVSAGTTPPLTWQRPGALTPNTT